MDEKKYVVTIARQFGSLGRPIAMRMSEKLGVEFYDRDIVEEAAKKLIFENAAEQYSQISTSDYESERLRRLFAKADHSPALDSQLLKQSVAGVTVESQSLKLLLWNGQYIGKDDFQ